MKLDMGAAWTDAIAMIQANRNLVFAVAGVFFFLPYFALMLFLPAEMAALQGGQAGADPEKMGEIFTSFFATYWWAFLLIGVAQLIGVLGLMVVLSDRDRPTLAQALATAARLFIPLFVAQLIASFALVLILFVPIMIGVASKSVAIGVLLGILALVAIAYVYTKFSLAAPIVAVERSVNPIHMLRRSWRLTKGNSLMLFLFYMLIVIAYVVVSTVASLVIGLIFALMGPETAMIGNGFVSSLFNAAYAALMAGILVAVYRQLSGETRSVGETFD